MSKNRLEAFSDGVLAIIITIMVLNIEIPQGAGWAMLRPVLPIFLSYVISFLFIGIYWGNHHNLFHTVKNIDSTIILANLNLLFWLSLLPLATGWMGENQFAPSTIVVYALVSLLSGLSYTILQRIILKRTLNDSPLRLAIQKQTPKTIASTLCCLAAIPLAFVSPILSCSLFILQSAIWIIPDKNVERALENEQVGN